MKKPPVNPPALKPIKYSKDGQILFDPNNHTYRMGDIFLTGVTSYISQFKNKFDEDYYSKKIAKRDGKTPEQVLSEWKQKADTSIFIGHCVHDVFENYANTGEISHTGILAKEYVAEQFINDYFKTGRLTPVEGESIVYSQTLASMRDMIVRDTNGFYYILDWKTNEEISRNHYGKFMKGPFGAVPDCTYFHYSIQLEIYKALSFDYDIKGTYIVHIRKDDYQIIKPAKINLPDEILYI